MAEAAFAITSCEWGVGRVVDTVGEYCRGGNGNDRLTRYGRKGGHSGRTGSSDLDPLPFLRLGTRIHAGFEWSDELSYELSGEYAHSILNDIMSLGPRWLSLCPFCRLC